MPPRAGYKKNHNDLPLVSELKEIGNTWKNLPALLETSKNHMPKLFQQPKTLRMSQIFTLCYLLQQPLGTVLNKLFQHPPQAPNYLDEQYTPGAHLDKIKKKAA